MTRVALYARYSSDAQNATSVGDQFAVCTTHALDRGWSLVRREADAALSGASMLQRPGLQALLADARARKFDVLLAEALDRISRNQADIATIYEQLQFSGVSIVTLAEGEISELHIGLKGTMNALALKDLAQKTHRGLRGRVEKGKSGGGLSYGYQAIHQIDAAGQMIRGDRIIDPAEAAIIRRVFKAFADGISPRALAQQLNDENIKGPRGNPWIDTTIRGHVQRGTGLLNNELYIGQLVWNRQRYIKNPATGKRVSRPNPPSEWVVTEVPDLRIVDDALWQTVKNRQTEIADQYANVITAVRATATNRLNSAHRPKALFSGLVSCGICGGPYTLRQKNRFACSNHIARKGCTNTTTVRRDHLEERVLSGLKERLFTPEAAAEALRAYIAETNRLNHERRASLGATKTELTKIERSIKGIFEAIENGLYDEGLKHRLTELRQREAELKAQMAEIPSDTPDIHPGVSTIFRQKVERLADTLNASESKAEAASILRTLVEKIVVTPGARRGESSLTLHGDLGSVLAFATRSDGTQKAQSGTGQQGVSESVVAGAGFEPAAFRL